MKKVIYALLVVLAVVAVIRVMYEYHYNKEEIVSNARFEKRQISVRKNGAPKVDMQQSIQDIEKIFYTDLSTCTKTNIADEEGTNYVIYGDKDGKCSFEKYHPSYSVQCVVPMNVAKEYAISGLTSKDYVNEINNNPEYCQIIYNGIKVKNQ